MAANTKMYPPFFTEIKALYMYSFDFSILVHKDLSAYFSQQYNIPQKDIPHLIYPVDEH